MLTKHYVYIDTALRIRARDCLLGPIDWLGVRLQVSEVRLGPRRRYRRFKCPVCKRDKMPLLFALPDPCCRVCAKSRGYLYSYQVKCHKRERAHVLANQASRKITPTAKRLGLAAALEAQSVAMSLDTAKLSRLKQKSHLKT